MHFSAGDAPVVWLYSNWTREERLNSSLLHTVHALPLTAQLGDTRAIITETTSYLIRRCPFAGWL